MFRLLVTCLLLLCLPATLSAEELGAVLERHAADIFKPKRKTVGAVLDDMVASGAEGLPVFLEKWQAKEVGQYGEPPAFYYISKGADGLDLTDPVTGEIVHTGINSRDVKQAKPNGGVRKLIGQALVAFQLSDPDIIRRTDAVDTIARSPEAGQLAPLIASIDGEPDAALKARKSRLANYLTAQFGDDTATRVSAIAALSDDLSVEARAVLNRILSTKEEIAPTPPEANIAGERVPGTGGFDRIAAYDALAAAELAPARISDADILLALEAAVEGGRVAGVPVAQLSTREARLAAYSALAETGAVPPPVRDADINAAFDANRFFTVYEETDKAVTDAAAATLGSIEGRVGMYQAVDLGLDAVSLASIYFLAAIGLAITFGVMGVINMAHGEFIMMGAYTGFVVQQIVPDYTLSLIIALPLAFAVTFGAGVAMERLVIRWLYHRPLETLLATFGISIALQQLAKNIFGTQARPLTSPGWLDGAWVVNDVVQISYIRIAIFALALLFLGLFLFIMNRTRLGLEVRAVTQNPRMAASMGINPDKINMLTFGLGSGIAGIAGVAIGLYAKVTSEMGTDYIVQSFMTVVVGGVGNVWGTLLGAGLIGGLQKGIEWLNPSNTLAAQTYMILFIILFIQFRPKGIIALKGRAAGD